MTSPPPRIASVWVPRLTGSLAVAFGGATLVEGGHVLFGGPEARAEVGHVVPFVLAFNFAAGFVYVAAGVGAALQRGWSARLAEALAVATLLVFAAFGVHVWQGGAFEQRTVGAMVLRSGFWVALAWAWRFRAARPASKARGS